MDFYNFWYMPCADLLVIGGISENDMFFAFFLLLSFTMKKFLICLIPHVILMQRIKSQILKYMKIQQEEFIQWALQPEL